MADLEMLTIQDRQIPIKKLNETQMMLIVREARVLKSDRYDMERKFQGVAFILDIVETAIVDAEDREWLMGRAGAGDVSFREMLQIAAPYENQIDGEVTVAPVRRGRAAVRK